MGKQYQNVPKTDNRVWAVVKAALILILAFIVAAIVKSLAVKLLSKTKLGSLPGKIRISAAQ